MSSIGKVTPEKFVSKSHTPMSTAERTSWNHARNPPTELSG